MSECNPIKSIQVSNKLNNLKLEELKSALKDKDI